GGNIKIQAYAPAAAHTPVTHHFGVDAAPLADHLHQHADKFLRHVDDQLLERLLDLPVVRPDHDFRLAHHQLVALAAHHLNQNRKLQLTPAQYFEGVRVGQLFNPDRDVGQQLLAQALTKVPRGDEGAFAPGERRGVD